MIGYQTHEVVTNLLANPSSYVVLVLLVGVTVLPAIFMFVRDHKRRKAGRQNWIQGNSELLFQNIDAIMPLSRSDRRLLRRIASRLKLAQPLAILLAPELLAKGAVCWRQLARSKYTSDWGIGRLNDFARKLHDTNLKVLLKQDAVRSNGLGENQAAT